MFLNPLERGRVPLFSNIFDKSASAGKQQTLNCLRPLPTDRKIFSDIQERAALKKGLGGRK